MARRTPEQRLAAAQEQVARLRRQIGEQERKARNHAMMVLGGELEAACGGDWRLIDPRALDAWVHAHAHDLSPLRYEDAPDTAEATRRLREFETWKREKGEEARLARQGHEGA